MSYVIVPYVSIGWRDQNCWIVVTDIASRAWRSGARMQQ